MQDGQAKKLNLNKLLIKFTYRNYSKYCIMH